MAFIEKEFQRQAGPRKMYGYVKVEGIYQDNFRFTSSIDWPSGFDSRRYNTAVERGIRNGVRSAGFTIPIGNFVLLKIKESDEHEANVPAAYEEAAYQAAYEFSLGWRR